MSNILFIFKSSCSTCRRVRNLLRDLGILMKERDMSKDALTREELDRLIGDRPHAEFLNSRNALYRERGYKTNPPSREAALDAMAEESNLVRRPILIHGDRIHFGSDEASLRAWFQTE